MIGVAATGVAATAVAGNRLWLVAILVGPVIEPPVLLELSRLMLQLCTKLRWPTPQPAEGIAVAAPCTDL